MADFRYWAHIRTGKSRLNNTLRVLKGKKPVEKENSTLIPQIQRGKHQVILNTPEVAQQTGRTHSTTKGGEEAAAKKAEVQRLWEGNRWWPLQWGGSVGHGEGCETDQHTGEPTRGGRIRREVNLESKRAEFHEFLQPVSRKACNSKGQWA